MEAQRRVLLEICGLTDPGVPVICAGDIFDKPNALPATEVLAATYLKGWFCIPGQHDLPNHRLDRVEESSYGVMDKAHVIACPERAEILTGRLVAHAFPYGTELKPLKNRKKDRKYIAVIHHLVYQGTPPYPGAPTEGNVKNIRKALAGYDVVVAGDNHMGFLDDSKKPIVVNCGSVMRRNANQEDYRPKAWILYADGTIEPQELSIEHDVFTREHVDQARSRDERIESFVKGLKEDVDIDLSFETNLRRYFEKNKVEQDVRDMIMEEME